MTIFVAGGSGAIGIPLVRALVTAGHNVVATTRSPGKQTMLRQLGAMPVVVDALDAAAMDKAVRSAAPTHVIHQLTALQKQERGARAIWRRRTVFVTKGLGAPPPRTIPAWLMRLAAPYMARLLTMKVELSNEKARQELAWQPMFPSYHEGLRQTFQKAA